ncbi:MAG: citrate/2-methylcitrate synthase [Planctomycetes bacterium]|nr:citrate/2-methylcitrate synthase [Planctomycetota bacterium]
MHQDTQVITDLILQAAEKARREVAAEPEPELTKPIQWPVTCTVGPGLEGAISCETKIGYVNGSKGWLIYRGYDIFDLCACCSFEEVAWLLLHGDLPDEDELAGFRAKLNDYFRLPKTTRLLMGFPVEEMNPMAALRMGSILSRQEFTFVDQDAAKPKESMAISADEDSIPMETKPTGEQHAIYEFRTGKGRPRPDSAATAMQDTTGFESCYHLLAGVATLAGVVARVRAGKLPVEPDPELSFAGNFLYMMTGRRPTPVETRVMDVAMILHADHGMNASTFAAMVVASTLSDIYFAVGSGIAALNGPLHGGANEAVLHMLNEIGSRDNVAAWYADARANGRKIMGFGHRVYKAYDPRARVLQPLAQFLARTDHGMGKMLDIADTLSDAVVRELGAKKGIFPNVDFYSGLVYTALGIPPVMFTPVFAVARVSGWTARVQEYLEHNRIFRPRAMYTGPFDRKVSDRKKRD